MNIYELRACFDGEIVDFTKLNSLLASYAHPRGKINQWLKAKALIRVKKGLYVFGEKAQKSTYSMPLLANLIYGPSAVSMESALSFYGLIPESVHSITSITTKRNKSFNTPVGHFSYQYLNVSKFFCGLTLMPMDENQHVLMACAEKALCDLFIFSFRTLKITSEIALEDFLFDNLRLDESAVFELSVTELSQISAIYKVKSLTQMIDTFLLWRKNHA